MSGSVRAFASVAAALCLLTGTLAPGALAALSGESEAVFKQQLATKQVRSVVINKYGRIMRVTLKDGTLVTARYPKKQSEQTAAHLRARGVPVSFVSKAQGLKEARHPPKKHHHRLRYIVGAVVIVVIVIVIAVLLIIRRRRRD